MSFFFDKAVQRASENIRTVVLPEGSDERAIEAAAKILELAFAKVILLGDVDIISAQLKQHGADPAKLEILNPATDAKLDEFANAFYEYRKHKGVTPEQAANIVKDEIYFGTMLVKQGHADGLVAGACHSSADTIRPALQIIKPVSGLRTISSTFFMCLKDQTYLFSDCALVENPSSGQLCDIAIETTKPPFCLESNRVSLFCPTPPKVPATVRAWIRLLAPPIVPRKRCSPSSAPRCPSMVNCNSIRHSFLPWRN